MHVDLIWAKMAKYHLFLKFLATEHCFINYWGSTTFSSTRAWWARVPYFLIRHGTMTWKAGIKIFCLVLEHLKLEYWLNSTRVLHTWVPFVHLLHNHLLTWTGAVHAQWMVLEFFELEYLLRKNSSSALSYPSVSLFPFLSVSQKLSHSKSMCESEIGCRNFTVGSPFVSLLSVSVSPSTNVLSIYSLGQPYCDQYIEVIMQFLEMRFLQ